MDAVMCRNLQTKNDTIESFLVIQKPGFAM
jgi:hypothetical protein